MSQPTENPVALLTVRQLCERFTAAENAYRAAQYIDNFSLMQREQADARSAQDQVVAEIERRIGTAR